MDEDDFMARVPAPIRTREALDALYPSVTRLAAIKVRHALDDGAIQFIAKAPLVFLGSTDAAGHVDVSPRGDAPGFVAVRDERTLVLPDRPGNNRLDTLRNLLENPRIGMTFLVPGVVETLRVNGRAVISVDEAELERCSVGGKRPRSVLFVHIDELFFHCGKALIRSRLFDDASRPRDDRRELPSLGELITGPAGRAGITAEEADELVRESYEKRLY